MANGKQLLLTAVVMIAMIVVLGFQLEAIGMLDQPVAEDGRADVIMIDTIAKLDKLEQSAVVFMHDRHTQALKKQGKNCESCHGKDDQGKMVLTFKRQVADGQAGPGASELKEIYHDGCLSCHAETAQKGFETGPMVGECRGCHQAKPQVAVERLEAGMDKALHFAHWDSKLIPADAGKETNCGACHEKAGEEDTWRADAAKTGKPVKEVFHNQCVTCHQSLAEKKAERTGPVECAGCHSQKGQEAFQAKAADMVKAQGGELPRLPRKQPDAVLMMPTFEGPAPEKATGMLPVAFDHKLHESKADDCRSCHVQGVNADMDTGFEAMHDLAADNSCVGCHAEKQKAPECAGCHAARPAAKAKDKAACATCHNVAGPEGADARLLFAVPTETEEMKEAKQALAASVIAERPEIHAAVAVEDIPETVTIGTIAKEYKASEMPHRKIVLKLMEGMQGNSLATTFHAAPEAMCAGCHHNSPATVTPPKCSSCHGQPFAQADEGMPGLKAAYHAQCMSCHTEMKLAKPVATDCVACHEKKAN